MQKYRLKFLWMDRTLGVCLDQITGKSGNLLLTDFYFWPQVDAWEKMKLFLEESSFVSQNDSILLLNQITEVINFWQEKNSIYLKDLPRVKERFPYAEFLCP